MRDWQNFRGKSQFYTRDSPPEAFDVGSLSSHWSRMRYGKYRVHSMSVDLDTFCSQRMCMQRPSTLSAFMEHRYIE